MEIVSRAEWGAAPAESVTPWNVAALKGVCVHWFGSPKAADSHAGCDDLLRSVQRGHQAGEFNDIAYNFGVCPHGTIYELRGWDRQTGANGTTFANENFLAIVYMAGVGDPFTDQGRASLAEIVRAALGKIGGSDVRRHGSFTGSECPGPQVGAWVEAAGWRSTSPSPAPEKEDVLVQPWVIPFLDWYITDRRPDTKPAGVPSPVPDEVMALVGAFASIHVTLGPPALFDTWADWKAAGANPATRPTQVPAHIPDEPQSRWWAGFSRDLTRFEVVAGPLKVRISALEAELARGGSEDAERNAKLRNLIAEAQVALDTATATLGPAA